MTESNVLLPLTKERIQASLKRNEWNYFIDDQGDIGSAWDVGRVYYLLLRDGKGPATVLLIAGYWEGVLTREQIVPAIDMANDWQAVNAMPKAYVQAREDKGVIKGYVRGDWVLGLKGGVTDEQLDGVIHSATLSVMKFFEAATEEFPQLEEGKTVSEY